MELHSLAVFPSDLFKDLVVRLSAVWGAKEPLIELWM